MNIKRIFTIVALLLVLTLSLSSCMFLPFVLVPVIGSAVTDMDISISAITETMGEGGMLIDLPNDFWEEDEEDYVFYYMSSYADVYAERHNQASFNSPKAYLEAYLQFNGIAAEIIQEDGLIYYVEDAEYLLEDGRYYRYVFENEGTYWIVTIVFFLDDAEIVEPFANQWAKTVRFEKNAA